RVIVDAVADEPPASGVYRPVEDAHGWIATAGREEILVPSVHPRLRVGAGAQERDRVDPEHRLVADDPHHALDPTNQPYVRPHRNVRGVVGAEREHPAAVIALGDMFASDR